MGEVLTHRFFTCCIQGYHFHSKFRRCRALHHTHQLQLSKLARKQFASFWTIQETLPQRLSVIIAEGSVPDWIRFPFDWMKVFDSQASESLFAESVISKKKKKKKKKKVPALIPLL